MLTKPEPNEGRTNFMLPPTMKRRVKEYADKHGVSEASALRYIITFFFDNGFDESKENRQCCQSEPTA